MKDDEKRKIGDSQGRLWGWGASSARHGCGCFFSSIISPLRISINQTKHDTNNKPIWLILSPPSH